ncbi:MinD/ParA/CobQ/CobA-like protein [Pseudobythopirellula maris]|uniref:MinD/ParA/CobQ/CobA-like protein n=1 Tax=Pseudobythopirellula maris TaxID=2527991 RepID=A0A5C5ZPI5_9BACT|nr:ParA family protein [Pseudobythopirellula maris]TWT89086.1 MinD/ParA/CobQ/CobA-like protein [Pseudobythopirellula maris]
MARVVTLYNNKGGVSKTTTLFNLAVYLSLHGKRVLIADCDPQCNATELFFSSSDTYSEPNVELPGTSVYQALLPRFKGEAKTIDPDAISLVTSELYPRLSLLRGDLEFSSAENYFGTAWNQSITENINEKNTYVVMHRMLRSLASHYGYDYVLCDVGPSTGAISRTVMLASDGFILPLTPDRFCYQAVRVLGTIIREWMNRHDEIIKTFQPYGVDTFPGNPMLFGAVIQNFKMHGGKVKESYTKWQEKISESISSDLLGGNGVTAGPKCNPKSPYVANMRDVGPLAPVAQMFGRAIFDIQQEHTEAASSGGNKYYGVVWANWVERMHEYEEQISSLAEAIQ